MCCPSCARYSYKSLRVNLTLPCCDACRTLTACFLLVSACHVRRTSAAGDSSAPAAAIISSTVEAKLYVPPIIDTDLFEFAIHFHVSLVVLLLHHNLFMFCVYLLFFAPARRAQVHVVKLFMQSVMSIIWCFSVNTLPFIADGVFRLILM